MKIAIGETDRRRAKQVEHNMKHGIVPKGVEKRIKDIIDGIYDVEDGKKHTKAAQSKAKYDSMSDRERENELKSLEKQMVDAARNLEFERAAQLRDQLFKLRQQLFGVAVSQ